ncbi:golvesin C-terminal-like domain-containing protein [Streptomyces sp. NBC_01233]|uniref:golvesin C-terminal-like domain-containing protein n=1 Tax=Streptomyces sp. NBC_01233 TaxID=2903787 RepID=UPI002E1475B6|nr:hypothetical protein OG332_25550 [Streptomyces sp. NBC_01233]
MQGQAWADPATRPEAAAADPSQVAPADREKVLGKGWKASTDRAWTTSGDAAGFHVLVTDQKAGYGWRTAATLAEPGFDADMWIGNACVTGSGKRAVVAYAPRTFTNKPELMARGAFTAVVDLDSGAVTKLDRQASLAYFSPGCGTGESAVLTQAGGDTKNQTRLLTVDAAEAKVSRTTELTGQVTSAVPVGKDIVAADAARLTRIDEQGRRTAIAHTGQVPFGLKADADGGLVYLDRPAGSTDKGEVKRISAADIARGNADKTKQSVLARGALTKMDVSSSAGGAVVITGDTQAADPLPKTVQRRPDVPKESQVTTGGKALVTKVATAGEGDPRKQDLAAEPKKISLKVLATGKDTQFTVTPSLTAEKAAAGTAPSPALAPAAPTSAAPAAKSAPALAAAQAASVAEPERYCSVARNDPAKQAMQPKPRQVEWAVDQIVNGTLDKNVSRPANWKNLGMPAYQPQTLFPRLGLHSGGRIPAQVLLGITAQESNMWQASRVVVPGVTGNPLIGNYYGIKYAASGQQTDPWGIDWAEADCGYGVTQITDGMRMHGKEKTGELPLTTLQQEAAALDYTANIAAGQRILADKWNVTTADGLKVNNGDPKYIENWFFALWAYNSGYYPKAAAASNGGLWGVGFTNNPANPLWKANRTPFLESPTGGNDYSHAKHPQDWPYQEKVLGWAARPLEAMESPGKMVAGFREAWWNSPALRTAVKPAESLFCTTANSCDPSKIGPNDKNEPGLGACTREDLKCWWNQPVTWKDCTTKAECGNEIMRFNDTYKEEADGTAYPPNCTTQGLPANALVVDDVPDGTPIHRPGCSRPTANSGTFTLDFATPSAKIDFQQLGAGYAGNFWFAHTRKSGAEGDRMKVTGTWKLKQALDKEAKVYVHLPDHGAHTKVATYEIKTANGWRQKVVSQPGTGNRWVNIGTYRFKGVVPEVRLTSITSDGTGDQDIAYDAVAFEPGTWNMLPEIVIPDENPNAPEHDFVDNDRQKQPNPQGVPAPLKALGKAPGANFLKAPEECRETSGKGVRQCVTLDYDIGKYKAGMPKAAPSMRAAAGAEDPLVSWCNDPSVTGYTVTRREGCHKLAVLTRWEKDGKTIGTAVFMVREETVVSNSKDFHQRMFVSPMSISPNLGTIKLDYWDALCTTNCSSSLDGVWSGATSWAPVGDSHWAIATRKYTWTKPTAGTSEEFDRGTVMKFSASSPEVAGSVVTKEPSWSFFDQIQCDNGMAVANSTGCVFGKHIPTWTADDQRFPPAAAYYWIMREKLPTHPGSKRHGTPMHRLKNPAMAKKNRETICNKSGAFAWKAHDDATPDAKGSVQCDEFPFAASQESGGSFLPIVNGGPCVQLYAEKHDDGKWRIHEDERADPPSWSEICGRASMPGKDNMDAGRGPGLSGFYTKARVLDGGPFYMELPSYEGCNMSDICIPRP